MISLSKNYVWLVILFLLMTTLLLFKPALAYKLLGPKSVWKNNTTTWQTTISGTPYPTNANTIITDSTAKWSVPSKFKFQKAPVGAIGAVTVVSVDFTQKGWSETLPGRTTTVAQNGLISTSAVYLNKSWSWNTNCTFDLPNKKIDFSIVVLHELGHALFLEHDQANQQAVMWPEAKCKNALGTDDINGMKFLYP